MAISYSQIIKSIHQNQGKVIMSKNYTWVFTIYQENDFGFLMKSLFLGYASAAQPRKPIIFLSSHRCSCQAVVRQISNCHKSLQFVVYRAYGTERLFSLLFFPVLLYLIFDRKIHTIDMLFLLFLLLDLFKIFA